MLKHRPSPALVVALVALILACAGSATAAYVGPGQTETTPSQPSGPVVQSPAYVYKESPAIQVPDNQFDVAIVTCPAGHFPISGGFVTPNSGDMVVKHSRPTNAAGSLKGTAAWTVLMKNPDSADNGQGEFRGYAICAPAASVSGP